MVSLKDIATACGVSTASVSKALNGAPDISQVTRERICSAAESMGYRPNSAARALKTSRTYNIGVLFKDEAGSGLTHEYFSAVLEGLKNEAESKDFDITFINTNSHSMDYYDHCIYRGVDGVAIVCANFADPRVQKLLAGDLPVVTIDYIYNGRMAVLSDNGKGAADLLKYVYSMGHRKIAFIHGAPSAVSEARLVGFYKTAEELGLNIPEEYVLESAFHDADGCAAMTAKLLDLPSPPTCILLPDDFSAMGGIREIRRRGLQIPRDISVTGYDGIQMAEFMDPPLTTLCQQTKAIGRLAAQKLIEQIEHPKTTFAEISTVEGTLRKGGSVGEPRLS